MSSLFEALKNLEKRQTQPKNPFSNTLGSQNSTENGSKIGLKQFFSRPFAVLIAILMLAVILGFFTLFAMDWYLKKTPIQFNTTAKSTQSTAKKETDSTSLFTKNANTSLTQELTNHDDSENSLKDSLNTSKDKPIIHADKKAMPESDTKAISQAQPDTLQEQPHKDIGLNSAPEQNLKTQKQPDNHPLNQIAQKNTLAQTPQDVLQIATDNALQTRQKNNTQNQESTNDTNSSFINQTAVTTATLDTRVRGAAQPLDDLSRWRKSLLEQAETMRKKQQFHEAIAIYTKLWNETHDPMVANNLAGIYLLIEEPQNTLTILTEAIKISPQDEDIKYNLELAQKMLSFE